MKSLLTTCLILLCSILSAQKIDSVFHKLDDEKQKIEQKIDNLEDSRHKFLDFAEKIESPLDKNIEATWDQGVPFLPENEQVTKLIDQLDLNSILNGEKLDLKSVKLCRQIGIAFYNRGLYEAANWYLEKAKGYVEVVEVSAEDDIHYVCEHEKNGLLEEKKEELSEEASTSIKNDLNFLQKLPTSVEKLTKTDLQKIAKEIDIKLKSLIAEKDSLIKAEASKEVIDSKDKTIKSLEKEKEIIDLSITNDDLKVENKDLEIETNNLKKWLIWAGIGIALLILTLVVLAQRKTIKVQDAEIEKQLQDINKKNTYLEHAARIIRHDMHSGINTYIPRGINSLEKRLTPEELINLRIEGSVKLIKEGLNHTQKVYKSVYEFTNLVKQNVVLDKKEVNLKEFFEKTVLTTSYTSQVEIGDLPNATINETLFWNAIDNLIKNGLKYNKSEEKRVKLYSENEYLVVEDNGVGLSESKFKKILSSYSVNEEDESGLGLNICVAILKEHGFDLICEKIDTGTKMKIKLS